jgi:hypothetical protein
MESETPYVVNILIERDADSNMGQSIDAIREFD